MRIVNKNKDFEPYLNERGEIVVSNGTEENLLVAEAVPNKKRFKILSDALANANLEDDIIFVLAYEALMGYYSIEKE